MQYAARLRRAAADATRYFGALGNVKLYDHPEDENNFSGLHQAATAFSSRVLWV